VAARLEYRHMMRTMALLSSRMNPLFPSKAP
jgi:hypothetical protein